jgi:transposase
MKTYSISDAARIFEIDRKTLRRWIRKKQIPTPALGIVNGRPSKVWTDKELVKIRQYFESGYWGKGIDRRTGKRAKGKKK